MKIYVAAKFEEKSKTKAWYGCLRAAGLEITCDWTVMGENTVPEAQRPQYLIDNALAGVKGVVDADALLLLPHPRGQCMFVEMGVALGLNKPVVVIHNFYATRLEGVDDFKPGVFFSHPLVTIVPDAIAALAALTKIALTQRSAA